MRPNFWIPGPQRMNCVNRALNTQILSKAYGKEVLYYLPPQMSKEVLPMTPYYVAPVQGAPENYGADLKF